MLNQEFLSKFEDELSRSLASLNLVEPLGAAVRYASAPPAKRIRPCLAFALCADFSGDTLSLMPSLIALEVLHCSSLVHDDLPALDNDDTRRGKASCHKAFSESTAILAGDVLATQGFRFIAQAGGSAELRLKSVEILSAAFARLCSGQVLDLQICGSCRPELSEIHRLKTGALFSASFELAAVYSGLNTEESRLVAACGERVGLGFQIVDDYLDVYGLEGKAPKASDKKNNKETFFTGKTRAEGLAVFQACREEIQQDLQRMEVIAGKKSRGLVPMKRTREVLESVFSKIKL